MAGVARILKDRGHQVSGSDIDGSAETERLEREGIRVNIGHRKKNISRKAIDLIVKTEAIPSDNPELKKAQKLGIPVWSRTETIQRIVGNRKLIAVAGTHGKSTISAMITFILVQSGRDPLAFLGAESKQLGGTARDGQGEWAIAEACEYRGQFWELKPELAVISNIEAEHLDFYHNLQELEEGFGKFLKNLKGRLFVYANDPTALKVARESGRDFKTYGNQQKKLKLKLFGRHNQINGQAAVMVAEEIGIRRAEAEEILEKFRGIKRRSEYLGQADGVKVYDDYAHHPTEISTTLEAFREEFPGKRIILVFQPHQSQRLSALFDQFVRSLKGVEKLIIVEAYEPPGRGRKAAKNSRDLAKSLGQATYVSDYRQALMRVQKEADKGDILLTMGAGPVNQVAEEFLK